MFNFLKKKSLEELIAEANLPANCRILQLEDGRYISSCLLYDFDDRGEWVDYESTATKDLKSLLRDAAYYAKKKQDEAKLEAMPRKVLASANGGKGND